MKVEVKVEVEVKMEGRIRAKENRDQLQGSE